jgi:hypothetical protein
LRLVFSVLTSFPFTHRQMRRYVLAVLALGMSSGMVAIGGAAAKGDGLTMLRQLEPGIWSIRYRDGAGSGRICVRSGLELLSLRPLAGNCRRSTVEDQTDRVVVQNSCQGQGYARTSIRRESNSLVQIEAQGFADGVPFSLSAEARRTGAC